MEEVGNFLILDLLSIAFVFKRLMNTINALFSIIKEKTGTMQEVNMKLRELYYDILTNQPKGQLQEKKVRRIEVKERLGKTETADYEPART